MEKLSLNMVQVWAVNSADSEYKSSVKGYYKDRTNADKAAKGSGWYGADGNVIGKVIYEDEDGNIYSVKNLGGYTDVEDAITKNTLKEIKNKLTQEEWDFLGVKY